MAEIYHRVRPDYPEALFDDLIALAGLAPGVASPRPGELPDDRAGIEASGLFEVTGVRQYDWEQVYDTEQYIELVSTFSGHLSMASWQRDRLYGQIRRRLARRPGRCGGDGDGAARRAGLERQLRSGAGGRLWCGPLDLAEELRVASGLVGLVQQEL